MKANILCAAIICVVSQGAFAGVTIDHSVSDSQISQVAYNEQATTSLKTLSESFKKGDEILLVAPIKQGADVNVKNKYGATALFMAVLANSTTGVRILLSAGAKPDALRPKTGESALFMAAQKKNLEIVDALIGAKADVNLASQRGLTPLFIANVMNANDIVRQLIKAGANPNIRDIKKNTSPLYIAAERGNVENIQMLLKAKANINNRTISGATPLYVAAEKGHLDAVVALLEAGADPHVGVIVNDTVQAPLVAAHANNHNDVIAFLEKSLPSCSDRTDFQDWGVFWMENYFSLEADLKAMNAKDEKSNLRFLNTSNEHYAFDFNEGAAVRNETDKHQIFVDGKQVYEGRWTKSVKENGSVSYAMPKMDSAVIELMSKGHIGEIRVIANMSGEFLAKSVKFSLEHFSDALELAKKNMSEVEKNKATGRCRISKGLFSPLF